jgi:hypothetical protein
MVLAVAGQLAGACSSKDGDDDDTSSGGSSAGTKGKPSADGGASESSGGNGETPIPEGGGGSDVTPSDGGTGQTGQGGADNGGAAGAPTGPSCEPDCELGIILNPKDDARTDPHPVFMLTSSTVYEWQYVDDGTQDPEFRSRLVSGALDVHVPPAPVGKVLMDLPVPPGGTEYPRSATFDATHLYVATYSGVTGKLLGSNAAAAPVFTFPAQFDCENLAVTPTTFYMTQHAVTGNSTPQAFYKVANPPASAATKPTAITGLGGRDQITDLLVVGNNLFWIENNLAEGSKEVLTAPITGLAGNANPTVLDPQVYTTEASLASDGEYLYWTVHVEPAGRVRRVKLTTLSADMAEDVSDQFDSPVEGIGIDADYVYFMDRYGTLYRALKTGGPNEELGDTNVESPEQVALRGGRVIGVDDKFVYFALNDGSLGRAVGRLPKVPL